MAGQFRRPGSVNASTFGFEFSLDRDGSAAHLPPPPPPPDRHHRRLPILAHREEFLSLVRAHEPFLGPSLATMKIIPATIRVRCSHVRASTAVSCAPDVRTSTPQSPQHSIVKLFQVEDHQVVLVYGEPGCGKSTQLPQFLRRAGWTQGGYQVALTQPQRVAAGVVAERLAAECGAALGGAVGFCAPFQDVTTPVRAAPRMSCG